jgi:hypothetical protein
MKRPTAAQSVPMPPYPLAEPAKGSNHAKGNRLHTGIYIEQRKFAITVLVRSAFIPHRYTGGAKGSFKVICSIFAALVWRGTRYQKEKREKHWNIAHDIFLSSAAVRILTNGQ